MQNHEIRNTLLKNMADAEYRMSTIAVQHVPELAVEIENRKNSGQITRSLFDKYLAGFNETADSVMEGARFIVIVSVPQPHERLTFETQDFKFQLPVPPAYNFNTDKLVLKLLRKNLRTHGFRIKKARIPLKLAAAKSGLAKYGKNNVTYIKGMGSFFRLVAFYTDFPAFDDQWSEPVLLKKCENCTICQEQCPTGAITSERFIINANRCLTYFNESKTDFPEWLDVNIHHCLIGCMICQQTCPLNKKAINIPGSNLSFSRNETRSILKSGSGNELQKKTLKKIDQIGLGEGVPIISRNLRVYLDNIKHSRLNL